MDLEQQFEQDRVEARSVAFTDLESSSDGGKFTGYAAVFDVEADLGDFTESISRGAFRKALSGSTNVPMLYDHNPMLPVLATTRSGTLKLSEDGKGLRVEADVANHFMGEAVREMVKRGDISGMSFGFVAGKGNSRVEDRGGKPHRNLIGFNRLLDVSPTWDEAYQGTEASFRSLRALQMAEDIESMQQVLSGAYSQLEDGAETRDADTGESEEQDATVTVEETETEGSEQQRSGVDSAETETAARSRRLQMMGLSLPKGDLKWLSEGVSAHPETRERPPRDIDEVIRYPRETWTPEEQRRVIERRKAVHRELFALTDDAERVGRNFSAEEAEQYGRLQDEFLRLSR